MDSNGKARKAGKGTVGLTFNYNSVSFNALGNK